MMFRNKEGEKWLVNLRRNQERKNKSELFVYWREFKIGKLSKTSKGYKFFYAYEYSRARVQGFKKIGEFLEYKIYESDTMFITFSIRIPSLKRKDFLEYLKSNGLNENSEILDILKLTRGELYTDWITLRKK